MRVRSDQLIPGLVRCRPGPEVDVEVRARAVSPILRERVPPLGLASYVSPELDDKGDPTLAVWEVGGGRLFRLRYGDGTEFLVSRCGAEVWAAWPEPLTLEDTATYLLGPVLALVLRLRGVVCLHASAVALEGRAVALVGPGGAGKSTTAAAFARLGIPVLSDDVAPLADRGDTFLVQPGSPRLRLWSPSARVLFGASNALPRLTPNWDKLYLELGGDDFPFQQAPLPLGAVYVLGERRPERRVPRVEPLAGRAGLMELVGNTYVNYLLDPAMRAREFQVLGRLVGRVPLRRVVPHEDPGLLPALCQVIHEDFREFLSVR